MDKTHLIYDNVRLNISLIIIKGINIVKSIEKENNEESSRNIKHVGFYSPIFIVQRG